MGPRGHWGPGHRHGHKHGWHWSDEPPSWWPEGEAWPPPSDKRPFSGHRWQQRRRRRRRILFMILTFWLLFWLVGAVLSRSFDRNWSEERRDDRNPIGLVAFTGAVLLVGSAGGYVAYRRLSRPVGALLDAADQVAEGDFAVDVEPGGPRELRALAHAFNEMAVRLADTTEQRRRFLADVSHELRTPLAVLQSGLEAQLDGIHVRDDEHISSLLEETRRLGLLVDDLHTLALADAGKLTLHREAVDVTALVDDAIAAHRSMAQRTGVELRRTAAVTRQVDVDPVRIRQVLDNLLSNAVRHTPGWGAVDVHVADAPGAVRVTVADAGAGFPPDQVAHVFERFTRSHDSGGSGLGLSIARDLVEAHGGAIEAHNRPGGGASVTFSLPVIA